MSIIRNCTLIVAVDVRQYLATISPFPPCQLCSPPLFGSGSDFVVNFRTEVYTLENTLPPRGDICRYHLGENMGKGEEKKRKKRKMNKGEKEEREKKKEERGSKRVK